MKEEYKPELQAPEQLKQPDAISQTAKAPKILLEILVYGNEEDKPVISECFDKLQKQMEREGQSNRARIFWFIDKGEKTDEQKREWLLENCNCKYYVFLNERRGDYFVPKDYIRKCMYYIKRAEDSIKELKHLGIARSEQKSQNQPSVPDQDA